MSNKSTQEKDIFIIVDELAQLVNSSSPIHPKIVDQICSSMETYLYKKFIPVEYAEKMLSLVANIVEKAENEGMLEVFASSSKFIHYLVEIVVTFRDKNTNSLLINSFRSHYSYELVLFILLGLAEKTKTLSILVKTLLSEDNQINSLLDALNVIVLVDELYLTQEMGLEILIRISYFISNKEGHIYETIKSSIRGIVLDTIEKGKMAVFSCLEDMRGVLNKLNRANDNIYTVPLRAVTVRNEIRNTRSYTSNGWLDVCKEYLCIHFTREDIFLRIKWQAINAYEFGAETFRFQVIHNLIPSKLKDGIGCDWDSHKMVWIEVETEDELAADVLDAKLKVKFDDLDLPFRISSKLSAVTSRPREFSVISTGSVSEISEELDRTKAPSQNIKSRKRLNSNKVDSLVRITSQLLQGQERLPTAKESKLSKKKRRITNVTQLPRTADDEPQAVLSEHPIQDGTFLHDHNEFEVDQVPVLSQDAAQWTSHDEIIYEFPTNYQDLEPVSIQEYPGGGSPELNLNRSMHDDQGSVISKIIEEITSIQSIRSKKRRSRLLMSADQKSRLQLQLFRDYWIHLLSGSKQNISIDWKQKLSKYSNYSNNIQNCEEKVLSLRHFFNNYYHTVSRTCASLNNHCEEINQSLYLREKEASNFDKRIEESKKKLMKASIAI